jgi:hypothetical protein
MLLTMETANNRTNWREIGPLFHNRELFAFLYSLFQEYTPLSRCIYVLTDIIALFSVDSALTDRPCIALIERVTCYTLILAVTDIFAWNPLSRGAIISVTLLYLTHVNNN